MPVGTSWRATYPAPAPIRTPNLWHPGYRLFWWDWLQDRKHLVLLRRGDWWQP